MCVHLHTSSYEMNMFANNYVQYELELMREEKRKAERQLQMLQQEREVQAEKFRQEAERIAEVW